MGVVRGPRTLGLLDSPAVLSLLFPPSLGHVAASARAELLTQWFLRHLDTPVSIAVAPSYEALRLAVERREVDLVWAPPAVCAAVQDSCVAILKAVRGHSSTYHAALVVRQGEAITLDDLRGGRAAWVDHLSTAGYLLPVAHLRDRDRDPEELLGEQVFTGSYGRAIRAVLDREADLSAIYVASPTTEATQASLRDVVAEAAPRLRAIDYTGPSPSDGLVFVERPGRDEGQLLLQQIRALTDGRTQTMLLTVLDAEALEVAKPGEYDVLRSATR